MHPNYEIYVPYVTNLKSDVMTQYLTDSIDKYVKAMKQEGLSINTITQYVSYIDKLADIDSRLYRLTNKQIQSFILMSNSESGQNCKINAIQKFYRINHPNKSIKVFIRPKGKKQIVDILNRKDVWKLINNINNLKQKVIVTCIYTHGLRVSEVLKLRYNDVDRSRGLLVIRQSKGKKDRLVPLNEKFVTELRRYARWSGHKKGYTDPIFHPYSKESISKVIKKSALTCLITKRVYPHLLRDCYATHLIEDGYDISVVQEILGHEDIETTRKYIHFSAKNIADVKLKL